MKFIQSPVKLALILKDCFPMWKRFNKKSSDWVLSKEGERAYQAAKTPAQRLAFFFDYMLLVAEEKNGERSRAKKDADNLGLYELAYFFANYVSTGSLAFSKYPQIFVEGVNPFLACIPYAARLGSASGDALLSALHRQEDASFYDKSENRPYERLSSLGAKGETSELWRMERTIISMFCMIDENAAQHRPFLYRVLNEVPKNPFQGDSAVGGESMQKTEDDV